MLTMRRPLVVPLDSPVFRRGWHIMIVVGMMMVGIPGQMAWGWSCSPGPWRRYVSTAAMVKDPPNESPRLESEQDFAQSHHPLADPDQINSEYENDENGMESSPDGTSGTRPPGGRRRIRPLRPSSTLDAMAQRQQVKAQQEERQEIARQDPSLLSNVNFDQCHPILARAAKGMGHQVMTAIQAETWPVASEGRSVLGRAPTGTGKTLAFLLPTLHRLLQAHQEQDWARFKPGRDVGLLIIAPTRELAQQIAEQAEALLADTKAWRVQCVVGGTSIQRDVALWHRQSMPTVLVATPGRLQEHVLTTRMNGRPFRDVLAQTRMVVLDEADCLVEGFSKELHLIISSLPRSEKRQTLLFSATLPKRLETLLQAVLPSDYVRIDCLPAGGRERVARDTTQTPIPVRVYQSLMMLPTLDSYLPCLFQIIVDACGRNEKVMVFFPTAKLVRMVVSLCAVGWPELPVWELHSKMSQASRNRVGESFRLANRGVLLASDVAARGVDFPEVDLVVQFGAPHSGELYTHRLGRTGRAGHVGKGLLVLFPFENGALAKMRRRNGMVLVPDNGKYSVSGTVEKLKHLIRTGHSVLTPKAEAAALSFLAYYLEYADGSMKRSELMDRSREFANSIGLSEMPTLTAPLVKQLERS